MAVGASRPLLLKVEDEIKCKTSPPTPLLTLDAERLPAG
jgi:hypothetical protein